MARMLDVSVLLAVAGIVVCTILSFFSERLWLGELTLHFRVQYLAVALAAAAIAMGRQQWFVSAAALTVALINAWPALPYLVPDRGLDQGATSVAGEQAAVVSLLELNLLYDNHEYARVRQYLSARTPDVLVLTELTAGWVRELQPVVARYQYRLAFSRESPWGLGVYSRYPLDSPRIMDLGFAGSVNVDASLRSPAGPVRFFAVHLASPISAAATVTRNRQLQALATLLAASRSGRADSQPQVLVGDLNITPFSPRFTALLAQTHMVDARRGRGWQGTWPAAIPPLRVPIDFCLVDDAARVTEVTRGPDIGSDHLPTEVRLRILRESAG